MSREPGLSSWISGVALRQPRMLPDTPRPRLAQGSMRHPAKLSPSAFGMWAWYSSSGTGHPPLDSNGGSHQDSRSGVARNWYAGGGRTGRDRAQGTFVLPEYRRPGAVTDSNKILVHRVGDPAPLTAPESTSYVNEAHLQEVLAASPHWVRASRRGRSASASCIRLPGLSTLRLSLRTVR